MLILPKQECREWLDTALSLEPDLSNISMRFPHSIEYVSPQDTATQTAVSKYLAGAVDTTRPGLLMFTHWGITDSLEMRLFDAYRRSLGETRRLIDSPGHVFDESDCVRVECLLDMALYLFWDACLLDGSGRLAVVLSNDEFVALYSTDAQHLGSVAKRLDDFGLERA